MIDEMRPEQLKFMNTFTLGRLLTFNWSWSHWLEKLLALVWTVLGGWYGVKRECLTLDSHTSQSRVK